MITLPVLETGEAEPLPDLYGRWLQSLLPYGIPREKRSDCANCPQVNPHNRSVSSDHGAFSADTKCCTYLPELPNYSVGGLLMDGGQGAATVHARIALYPGCITPFGLMRTELYQTIYSATRERAFGRAPLLLCPHYLSDGGGTCGVWRHRNHVCATWFCLHERSWLGHSFWVAMRELLGEVERQLSTWCVQGLLGVFGTDVIAIQQSRGSAASLAGEITGRSPWPSDARLWKEWATKKCDFFSECARRVSALSWRTVTELIGTVGRSRIETVKAEYEKMLAGTMPDKLAKGTIMAAAITDKTLVRLGGPGTFEKVELSLETIRTLEGFDGRPTEEVLAEMPVPARDALSPDVLLRLLEIGALVESQACELASTVLDGMAPAVSSVED
jgi:hypothetical protein